MRKPAGPRAFRPRPGAESTSAPRAGEEQPSSGPDSRIGGGAPTLNGDRKAPGRTATGPRRKGRTGTASDRPAAPPARPGARAMHEITPTTGAVRHRSAGTAERVPGAPVRPRLPYPCAEVGSLSVPAAAAYGPGPAHPRPPRPSKGWTLRLCARTARPNSPSSSALARRVQCAGLGVPSRRLYKIGMRPFPGPFRIGHAIPFRYGAATHAHRATGRPGRRARPVPVAVRRDPVGRRTAHGEDSQVTTAVSRRRADRLPRSVRRRPGAGRPPLPSAAASPSSPTPDGRRAASRFLRI
ncbi:hypothetical protein SAMN05216223_102394 [Actinacidiphila yanglinensis]|uniref:Uncharacterized protein n=1 Tax=Actinacidiphila yanglinensis TaxID=310779 RepID=A0A1H5VQR3_9ACTN|nr:hypothetical protein SAMN05216223_102394 [Actinacidiphila yanglinensis]